MTEQADDLSNKRFPWLRSGFDLEGYVGAIAAWVIGILLGIIWGPLFWIGFVAAVIILFATRTAERTPPIGDDLIVAPLDGTVVSVVEDVPPAELQLGTGDWRRVRVSIGPTRSNGLFAPVHGAIASKVHESGDPKAVLAIQPEAEGLAVTYLSFESGNQSCGYRLATGGFGPRLEVDRESGDAVKLGRTIGTLRLGGWCDIYVPATSALAVLPGQTLIGSETIISRFGDSESAHAPERVQADIEEVEAAIVDTDEPSETDEEGDLTLERIAETDAASESEPVDTPETESVADMLDRLRKEARKPSDER